MCKIDLQKLRVTAHLLHPRIVEIEQSRRRIQTEHRCQAQTGTKIRAWGTMMCIIIMMSTTKVN